MFYLCVTKQKDMYNFKTASEIKSEIKRLINVDVAISDNKIYKKQGKKYIVIDEKLGQLFCRKTNTLLRLQFVQDINCNGANKSVMFI